MRRLYPLMAALFMFNGASAFAGDFPDIADRSYTEANGSRVLKLTIRIEAPATSVWALFSSAEGWQSWAVPVAWVDFGVGGTIETSYDANATRGRRENIKNAIVAYVPGRLIALRNVQAPPDFEHAEEFGQTVTVISLRSSSGNATEVELDGVGYRPGMAFDALFEKFRRGDSWTLEQLKKAA